MNPFDYIRTYSLPSSLLQQIRDFISSAENSSWTKHSWYNHENKKTDDCTYDPFILTVPNLDLAYGLSYFLFSSYYKEFPEATASKFSQARLNRYEVGTYMSPHWDSITTLFEGESRGVPILSTVGLINSCDEGGHFIFTLPTGEKKEFLKEEGTGIVFPSTFIYKHEVTPVISGVRDSFVSWSFC